MIRYESEMSHDALLRVLNELGADIERTHRDLSEQELAQGLLALGQSPFNYGLLDLTDEQHLGLLYYWIVQVRTVNADAHSRAARLYKSDWARQDRKQKFAQTLYRHGFYKLAIIGAGSAAAYYVNALGEGYDHRHTLLVGEPDPWRPSHNKRSRGTGYINHEAHLIGQWGKVVPRFGMTYVDRGEFADSNAEVLRRIRDDGGSCVDGSVKQIALGRGPWIRIHLASGRTLWAEKVVLATGAGPHAKRGFEVTREAASLAVDLDAFMRTHPSNLNQGGKSIIVHGPNAGIDAVERAGECGFSSITWLMSESSSPPLLPGNRLLHAPHVPTTKLIERDAFGKLGVKPQKSIVMISKREDKAEVAYVTPSGAVVRQVVDLYVYALGQDGDEEGAVRKVLGRDILDQLVPIYDIQGRHATAQELDEYERADNDAKPRIHENTIVGFQLGGTTFDNGIEVIGAAANMVASREQQEKMKRVVKTQPGTVLTVDQLGTIKSAIGSQNSVMPRYVTRDVNLSTDDRTVLRTHIAVKYPNISEEQAQRIIEEILTWRRTTDTDMTHGYHPLGYDEWWQRHFRQMLEYWNAPPSQRRSVVVRHELENRMPLKGRPGFHTL